MDNNRLSQFEDRIRGLVEGSFARLFAGRVQPREVALRLARAMEDGADLDERGNLLAPNRYLVSLHPDDHAALLAAQPDLPRLLSQHLLELARRSDLLLERAPEVRLVPEPRLTPRGVAVMAEHVSQLHEPTQAMMPLASGASLGEESPEPTPSEPALPRAFLVLDGSRYVPLDRAVIHLGRRRDNTIVVDDVRVSRQHAQLRLRFGQFVLYDLGSSGGTYVNDRRVSEQALQHGDVISLAGAPLIYVLEEPEPPELPDSPGQPGPGDTLRDDLREDGSPENAGR